jgi:hypothetical protein
MMSMVVVASGCGGIESIAWDKNHDGLISQCEGIDRLFCGLTPGCEGQELACLAICQDDGHGGCVPCPDSFQCVPKAPVACANLNAQQCSADPRCIADAVVCTLECRDDGNGGCLPCNGVPTCRDRNPSASCALVPINSCASIPACEVQTQTICAADHGETDGRKPNTPPEQGCGGGCTTTQFCVNKPVQTCESTPVSSCLSNPSCQIESGNVCDVACQPGSPCPPCATPQPYCTTRPAPSCSNLPLAQCTSAVGCTIESYACADVCLPDGNGGCKPCDVPPPHCVPLTVASPQPAPGPK